MKRAFSLALALFVLVCGTLALAEVWPGAYTLDEKTLSIDLDGDGTPEAIWLETVPDDFESFQSVRVVNGEGDACAYDMEIISLSAACVGDMNNDGVMEIFVSGDIMSDDYYTWCLHYVDGELVPVLFPDCTRGDDNGNGYYKSGYGMLTEVGPDGEIALSGSQDMLGTYFMERRMSLTTAGLFEFSDDGWWIRDNLTFDADLWDGYGVLTASRPIPCEIDGESATINPGERIVITGTDKTSAASFTAEDGRSGMLAIQPDYIRGWGTMVDGVSEDELFEMLPYAD